MPCFTLFNGSCLLVLTILAIVLNMIPLIVNCHDGRLFRNSISCYEWWLPGIFGGGILVIPTVSMSLAARKGQNCNTKTGLLLSALFSLISVLGALYCVLVSLHSLIKGPLVCDTESHSLENCSFSIEDIKSLSNLKIDLKWFVEDNCGINQTGFHIVPTDLPGTNFSTVPTVSSVKAASTAPTLETDVDFQKTIHRITFSGLFLVGILEVLVSALQIIVGVFGFICGTSKRRRSRPV
ncbi:transmembrane 4 L6 family member 20-like [Carcharodon carcharias]|uniref:transmembrane 4 L6 family member 20-like n=1 Tax=Carcharodon carcharias TaxID=13397 RepID=UPI001B7EE0A9|nr:transmembrane 4 L6 family member 20-like [Carcharodon carcharias]